MEKNNSNNPWADRWEGFQDGDRAQDALVRMEAQDARDIETHPCIEDGCDGTAHYRPGVGGWWCAKCGEYQRV